MNTVTLKKTLFALNLAMLCLVNPLYAADPTPGEGCVIAGPSDAPVTIQEFADLSCKYCAKGSNTMAEVLNNYAGKVKLVFRNMPLPFHLPNAMKAAQAFTAIYLQSPSLAYAFQSRVFAEQDQFAQQGEKLLYDIAGRIGADVVRMRSDMTSEAVMKIIADDQQLGASNNVTATPSFLVGSVLITGAEPYAEFKKVIDRELGQQ